MKDLSLIHIYQTDVNWASKDSGATVKASSYNKEGFFLTVSKPECAIDESMLTFWESAKSCLLYTSCRLR